MKTVLWLVCLIPLLLRTCLTSEKADDRMALAKVAGETVFLDEALEGMPEGLAGKDSADYVKEYLNNRIKDKLIYEMAVRNVPQSKEIDIMVENYRRSLMVYEYQQQVLNEKVQSEVSEEELKSFYEQNSRRFSADQHLVKGFFLKVPNNAPNIDQLRKWYKKPDAETLQKIEAYSVQNASIYNYFMEQWVSLEDILGNMPLFTEDKAAFLSRNHTFEATDDEFCYLLYIDEHVLKGETAPYEYIRPVVVNVMLNTRKTDFLRQFEQDLLKEAEEDGKLTFY
jgi:hypothetical protein